ncbi:ORF-123 [Teiidae poxvirus 1]|nr:ORF-123 [Teiidae poxvirus 1]
MDNYRCDVDKCVRKFETLVIRTWDHDLNGTSFLRRKERKVIRNLFRLFIYFSCDKDLIHGVQSQLIYPKSLDNYFLNKFIKYNNQGLKKLYNKIDASDKRIPDLSTKGKYILYCVVFLIYMGNNNIEFNYSDSARSASKKIAEVITEYLRLVSSVHFRYRCKYMFIGFPVYYLSLISADDLIVAMESISDKSRNRPNEGGIYMEEMTPYQDYLNFIIASKKAKNKGLTVSLCGITFETDYSISEFIMDGLCFCFTDAISIKSGYSETVQVYTKCNIRGTHEYIKLNAETPSTRMPFNACCFEDCSAIRIVKDKDYDFYQNRHTFFFADDHHKWKWYLDNDTHPSYDYSRDRERTPEDYKEFYTDNSKWETMRNCDDDIVKDEAPILEGCHRRRRRGHRYQYDDVIVPERRYDLRNAREFEDEMLEAIAEDDYTPMKLKDRRNINEDDYYYDRGSPRNTPLSEKQRLDAADKSSRRLEDNGFKERYDKIRLKMGNLEDNYDNLRRRALELPGRLDGRNIKSWF